MVRNNHTTHTHTEWIGYVTFLPSSTYLFCLLGHPPYLYSKPKHNINSKLRYLEREMFRFPVSLGGPHDNPKKPQPSDEQPHRAMMDEVDFFRSEKRDDQNIVTDETNRVHVKGRTHVLLMMMTVQRVSM